MFTASHTLPFRADPRCPSCRIEISEAMVRYLFVIYTEKLFSKTVGLLGSVFIYLYKQSYLNLISDSRASIYGDCQLV